MTRHAASPPSTRPPARSWRRTTPSARPGSTRRSAEAHAAYPSGPPSRSASGPTCSAAVGKLLTERREEYAALITAEMGKPLAEALAEVDKCAWNCEVVADLAPGWLADHEVASAASRSWLSYEPLGVVFAVMPWNYPFWQVLRFACAALGRRQRGVLKHSPNVTGCALAIEELFADAGAPAGLFRRWSLADPRRARDDAADHRRPAGRRGDADRQRARR